MKRASILPLWAKPMIDQKHGSSKNSVTARSWIDLYRGVAALVWQLDCWE